MKYWWLSVALILSGCGLGKKCVESNQEPTFMHGHSILQIPISISNKDLEDYIDHQLPDTLFQDDDAGGQDIDLLVRKTGRPSLTVQGQLAEIVLPLSIKAKRNMGFLSARAEGDLFLGIRAEAQIDSSWVWAIKTEVSKVDWVKEPKLKMAGLNFSVKGIIERLLTGENSPVTQQLDAQLTDGQPLKKMIEDVMPYFNRTHLIDPEGQYHVQIQPLAAGLARLDQKNGQITTAVRVRATAEVLKDSLTPSPQWDVPHFEWVDINVDEPNLIAHLSFRDEEIEALMRTEMIGQEMSYRGKKVSIDQIYFDLQDRRVKCDAFLSGGLKGKVHFEGQPLWDRGKDELTFCDVKVDLKVEYGISRFLLWLSKSAIKKTMVNKLEKEINQQIEDRIGEINTYLSDFQPTEGVLIQSEIFDYFLSPLEITDRQVKFGINLSVRGKFDFQGLNFLIQ